MLATNVLVVVVVDLWVFFDVLCFIFDSFYIIIIAHQDTGPSRCSSIKIVRI
jgi:hypothetical protein